MVHVGILAALTEIFRDVFEGDDLVVSEATTADDVDGRDSVNHITLVVETERRFKVNFQTAEIEELNNVHEFIVIIKKIRLNIVNGGGICLIIWSSSSNISRLDRLAI